MPSGPRLDCCGGSGGATTPGMRLLRASALAARMSRQYLRGRRGGDCVAPLVAPRKEGAKEGRVVWRAVAAGNRQVFWAIEGVHVEVGALTQREHRTARGTMRRRSVKFAAFGARGIREKRLNNSASSIVFRIVAGTLSTSNIALAFIRRSARLPSLAAARERARVSRMARLNSAETACRCRGRERAGARAKAPSDLPRQKNFGCDFSMSTHVRVEPIACRLFIATATEADSPSMDERRVESGVPSESRGGPTLDIVAAATWRRVDEGRYKDERKRDLTLSIGAPSCSAHPLQPPSPRAVAPARRTARGSPARRGRHRRRAPDR